ncbi:MAG: LON peptidase substrate-binding domain-containing protein [bacterium]
MNADKIQDAIPIFPLPNVVFFPKTLLPMHIFEERYRELVTDALRGSNQIGMVLLKYGWEKDYFGAPQTHEIGCVGDIQFSEKLENGKYNILLYGLCRIKILQFVQESPYRIARVQFLKDRHVDHDDFNEHLETESFLRLVHKYLHLSGVKNVKDLFKIHAHSFESILNQAASILDFSTQEKQALLELNSLEMRHAHLKSLIKEKLTVLKIARTPKFVPEDPSWN